MSNLGVDYVVPWLDKDEWMQARQLLTSPKIEDVLNAYDMLETWKIRTDSLPAFVECTYGILKVMVQEHKLKTSRTNDYDTRLSYSTEILRFVNHVHNTTRMKGTSLYSSAKINNIPDWIVTLRHDAAHGQTLPALETFHLAAKVCMNWLLKNYWFLKEKYATKLDQPFKYYAEEFLAHNVNVRLFSLYRKTIRLWETCCEISNDCLISDLPNEHLYYISNLVRLFKSHEYTSKNGDHCDVILKKLNNYCVNSNEHRLKDLKRSVIELMKYITINERPRNTFMYTILKADFMYDFTHVEWRGVIFFIQIVKCFDLFVKSLFDLAVHENNIAVKMLETLAPAIENLKRQWPRLKEKFKRGSLDKKERKKLKTKYCRSYKYMKFPLKLQKPPPLKLYMLEDLLKAPSRHTKTVIEKYLPLLEPKLPSKTIEDLTQIVEIYCDTGADITEADLAMEDDNSIFTMEDIKSLCVGGYDSDNDMDPVVGKIKWNKSDIGSETWSSCPIGLLPNETTIDLTIPEEYVCQEAEHSVSHPLPPLAMPPQELQDLLNFEAALN